MNKRTVYLAGPISGLTFDDAQDWRNVATRHLAHYNIQGLSPLRAQEYLRDEGVLTGTAEECLKYKDPMTSSAGLTHRDRWDAMRCDVLLVNLLRAQRVSIGTMFEIAWADSTRKPIVVVMEPGNIHEHAMLFEMAPYRYDNLNAALDAVVSLLL